MIPSQDTKDFAEVVKNFNDLVKPLRNIQSFKGSDYFVNEFVRQIRSFLESRKLLPDTSLDWQNIPEGLREIFLLLLLNTDSKYLYTLPEDAFIRPLIQQIPELSMCLFYMLIWKLDWREFLLEFMAFAPLEFVADLLVIFPEAMKYLADEKDLVFGEKFIVALYWNISSSGASDCDAPLDFCKVFLDDYFNGDPDAHPDMPKKDFYLHLGYMIRHMLRAIIDCLKIFLGYSENEELRQKNLPYKLFFMRDVDDEEYDKDMLLHFNEKLFGKLQCLLDRVTVLIFCEWVEVDVDENVTLQQSIRELALQFIGIPNEDNELEHEIFQQVKFLAKNDDVVANVATVGEILQHLEVLEDVGQKSPWIGELISRGSLVLENEECLEVIDTNLLALKLSHYAELAHFLQNNNPDTEEIIRDIILKGLVVLPVEDAVHLMNTELIYLPVETMQKQSFALDSELFFTSKKWTESGYLRLLAQNPQRVIENMSLWVIEHEKDMKVALKFLQMTQKITDFYLEENIKALLTFPDGVASSRLLGNWICRLFNCGLIKKSKVVRHLSKNLVEFVTRRDERRILGTITIFSGLAQKSSFGEDSIKVLTIAARVLDNSRWRLETFTEDIKEIVRLAIVTIVETMKDFLKYASQTEKTKLKEKVSSCSPATGFYFQKLSLEKHEVHLNFAEYLFQKNSLVDVPQEDLEDFLLQKIIHITPKETVWMVSNEFLRPQMEGILRQIAISVSDLASAVRVAPAKCFRNCMTNYQQAFEKVILPELVEDRDKVLFLHRILELFQVIPVEIYEEIVQNFTSLILPLFDDVLGEEECIPDCHTVLKDQIMCLKDGKFKKNLLGKFFK